MTLVYDEVSSIPPGRIRAESGQSNGAEYDGAGQDAAEGEEPDLSDLPEEIGPNVRKLIAFTRMPNIAATMMESGVLGNLGERVKREYLIDKASRSDWETKMGKAMDQALQVSKPKQYPFPNASNVKFPLTTSAAMHFAARAYPALVPGTNMVQGKVIGSDNGMPQMGEDGQPVMDEEGNPAWDLPPGAKRTRADRVGRHMTWQLQEEMPEWEGEFDRLLHVVPIVGCSFKKTYFDSTLGRNMSEHVLAKYFVVNAKTKSLATSARGTHEFSKYPYEISEYVLSGDWLEHEYGNAPDAGDDDDAPHWFLEQYRRIDLDGDKYAEPYLVTIHKESGKVVRIVALYDEEGIHTSPDDEDKIIKIERVEMYTKYGFIPNPDGSFYDIGFGILMGPLNASVNSVLNQLIDAGHLANTPKGFVSADLRMKQTAGKVTFRPNEFKVVQGRGGAIRDSVFQLEHPEPSVVLFQLLGLLIDAAKDIGSIKDVMTGDQQRTQPATTTLALIEQGMKVFSAVYKRLHRSLKHELKKLYRLNRLYMNPEQYFTLEDDIEAVLQSDYEEGSNDIVPVSDPTVITDMQKLARAQILIELKDDPMLNGVEIRKRFLDAAGIEGGADLVVEPSNEPDPQMLMMIAEMENAQIALELKQIEVYGKTLNQLASAVEKLAKAESYESGEQLTTYLHETTGLIDLVKTQMSNDEKAKDRRAKISETALNGGSRRRAA